MYRSSNNTIYKCAHPEESFHDFRSCFDGYAKCNNFGNNMYSKKISLNTLDERLNEMSDTRIKFIKKKTNTFKTFV